MPCLLFATTRVELAAGCEVGISSNLSVIPLLQWRIKRSAQVQYNYKFYNTTTITLHKNFVVLQGSAQVQYNCSTRKKFLYCSCIALVWTALVVRVTDLSGSDCVSPLKQGKQWMTVFCGFDHDLLFRLSTVLQLRLTHWSIILDQIGTCFFWGGNYTRSISALRISAPPPK